jgi:addiction module HigA family antidote
MRPIHPGEILKEEIIDAYHLRVTAAAKLLGVSRVNLSNILNQKSDISPEMAYRIAKVFGGTADIWANLQTKYNMQIVGEKMKEVELERYLPEMNSL